MKGCEDCDLRGYSRELCVVHLRHCRDRPQLREVPESLRVSARVAGGMAVGATAGLLVATAASFVGGAALLHALLLKLVASSGVVGGAWGLARGLSDSRWRRQRAEVARIPQRRRNQSRSRRMT